MDIPDVRPSLKSRVQRRLNELGITPAEAARRGQLSRTLIYDIQKGIQHNVRGDTAAKLAEALDADVEYFIGVQLTPRRGKRDGHDHPRGEEVQFVPVVGVVAAGVWNEITSYGVYDSELPAEVQSFPPVPVVPDPRYRGLQQFAVKVIGTSINLVIPDGYFAVCVPYWEARGAIQAGDLVVVERIRADLHESTIKRVKRGANGWELWPESDDARFQKPTVLAEDLEHEKGAPEVTVEIRGLVIWKGAPV